MNGGSGWLGAGGAGGEWRRPWHACQRQRHRRGISASTGATGLDLLSNVIKEIERERFEGPALSALAARLTGAGGSVAASRGIARLARIAEWADSRHNVFVRLSELPLLFTLQVAYACESWRRGHGRQFRDWVDAVDEVEALLSLAGYSYEHPADPFAELVDSSEPLFDATEIAHPLLPGAVAVSNSFVLASPRVLIVSGSNMSGKSTLMRTTGVNAVLALAGAPVRAGRLRLTPLTVGTCLRHTDSLQEHRSGFYTEALRIRRIFDLLDGPLPVVFVFDELLSGTNSKDRRIAAEGVIRTMLSKRAIGMVTTHDLALTEIAAIFPGEVRNVHLQDHVEDGKMQFDYKLRDVCTHSNALEQCVFVPMKARLSGGSCRGGNSRRGGTRRGGTPRRCSNSPRVAMLEQAGGRDYGQQPAACGRDLQGSDHARSKERPLRVGAAWRRSSSGMTRSEVALRAASCSIPADRRPPATGDGRQAPGDFQEAIRQPRSSPPRILSTRTSARRSLAGSASASYTSACASRWATSSPCRSKVLRMPSWPRRRSSR